MARKRVVSRTIKATVATVLRCTVENAEVHEEIISMGGTFKSNNELLKKIQKLYDTDEVKTIAVKATEVTEKLYKMPEDQFIELAYVEE